MYFAFSLVFAFLMRYNGYVKNKREVYHLMSIFNYTEEQMKENFSTFTIHEIY